MAKNVRIEKREQNGMLVVLDYKDVVKSNFSERETTYCIVQDDGTITYVPMRNVLLIQLSD